MFIQNFNLKYENNPIKNTYTNQIIDKTKLALLGKQIYNKIISFYIKKSLIKPNVFLKPKTKIQHNFHIVFSYKIQSHRLAKTPSKILDWLVSKT